LEQFTQKLTRDLSFKVFAVIVAVAAYIPYIMTMQPGLSLWDCGEFLACSYTLGISHPPGTPLFLIIGRLSMLLPTFSDICMRLNWLSVLSSVIAAVFGYLISVRLIKLIPGVAEDRTKMFVAYFCSMIGALLLAYSRTLWFSTVEAEAYTPAMAYMFLVIWLTLRWYDVHDTSAAFKYLVLIVYLLLLSVGIQVMVMLVMPATFIFFMLADETLRRDTRFWISAILIFLQSVNITWFLFGTLVWLATALICYLASRSRQWLLALAFAAAALLGYSVHAELPIRAKQQPHINQNDPQTWDRFISYIHRKQYGEESMFSKMLHRRASWAHQLGDFPRIGFGGFLTRQYGMTGIAFLIPAILTIIGIISLIKWKWKLGTYMFLLLLTCSLGLVIYMNFADGSMVDPLTGNDRLEVRVRDYFFTSGFILFALYIGIGLFVSVNKILDRLGPQLVKPAAAVLGILMVLMPIAALNANYKMNDRHDDYLPYDYAYNFLMSCPQDAILFTNGDNDTFTLWCLQEVYGVRRDVRIANLSLIQTDWYEMQLKHQMGVPVSFEDDQMLWEEVPSPRGNGTIHRPKLPYVDRLRGGWEHYLMAFQDDSSRQVITVAHLMVENIISANRWKYPIVFANGYPPEVRYPLADHMIHRGWLDQLVPEVSKGDWNVDTTMHLVRDVFQMRNLNSSTSYRDEVTTTLVIGSAQMMIEFSDYLAARGDTVRARAVVDLVIQQTPEFWLSYDKKAGLEKMSPEQKNSLYENYFAFLDRLIAINPDNYYYYQYKALSLQFLGRGSEAIPLAEKAYLVNPAIPVTFRTLVNIYVINGKRDDAIRISREFLKTNPDDQTARAVASGRF
jgi:hypothetical protein